MWKQTYSKVFTNIAKEAIWKVWTDITNWPRWHIDIHHATLSTPLLPGGHLTLHLKFGPTVKATLITIDKDQKLAYRISFFGGDMYVTHDMTEEFKGLKLTTTLEVNGPLALIWRKLVAKKIASTLCEQTRLVVSLCNIQTENVRAKIHTTNRATFTPILSETFTFESPENNPGLLLWQSTINWQQNIKKSLEQHSVSHTQFAIMFIALWSEKNKQPLTQASICTQSKLDKVTVSKALKQLEEQNRIEKLKNEHDSRTKLIRLTPEGRILAENLVGTTKDIDKNFFEKVECNESIFIDMMKTLGSA
jgi:DNA-binding MarR family transcriptional regulator